MEEQFYFRTLENMEFTFVVKGTHNILETDIPIKSEEYNEFIELRSKGNQYRVKETQTGNTLFDYIEEYTPEIVEEVQEPGTEDYLLDLEYRISKLELGV